jgi:hypothetical protein
MKEKYEKHQENILRRGTLAIWDNLLIKINKNILGTK